MKKSVIGIIAVVILAVIIVAVVAMNGGKKEEGKEEKKLQTNKIETVEDMQKTMDDIYSKLEDEFPSLETREIDITDELAVTSATGLKSSENVEAVVISEPLMSSQAYSAVLVKVSKDADIEKMKKEMLDNIDTRKWICVTAEKVYVTNNENIIFLVMADDDWAKPVYEGFKKEVGGNIGKELQRTEEI